jgi:sporulation protein YlmC with PRC-barrel domain
MSRPNICAARSIVGKRVVNEWGIDLGRIEDVAIDLREGRVRYVAMQYRCSLGTESKLFAVPWESLTLHEETGEFILDVLRDLLEEIPGFDRNHWPESADPTWDTQVYISAGSSSP